MALPASTALCDSYDRCLERATGHPSGRALPGRTPIKTRACTILSAEGYAVLRAFPFHAGSYPHELK